MGRKIVTQNNFNAGEFSPRLHGRSDLSKYKNAVKTATNCTVFPHGPITRRNGSQLISEVKDSAKEVNLIKFQFSENDAFILEFGDTYIRFYKNSAQVLEDSKTITNITQANPGVVTSVAHGYSNGDHVYITGVVGMTEVNKATVAYEVANKADDTFELTTIIAGANVNTTSFTAYSSGGISEKIYEIVSPYDQTEVQNLTYVQFGNILYFAHPSFEPRTLTRTGDTNWAIATLDAIPEPTVELGQFPATTVTPAATTGVGINFTAGVASFLAADIGRQIHNLVGAGRASITAITSTTIAVCTIIEDFPSTSAIASGDWKIDLSPICDLTPTKSQLGAISNVTADLADSGTAVNTFKSGDVGRYILMHDGVLQIVTVVGSSSVNCEVLKSLTSLDETSNWTLEDPAWSSSRGFPRAVGLFEERLIFGGTATQPQSIWFSETGIFNGFGIGTADSDGISVDLVSNQVNQVQWIAATNDLIVGTSGSEITINGGSASSTIGPTNIRQQPRTYYGSATQTVANVENEILFLQKTSRKVRSFRFDFNIDGYAAEDLSFLAEHMTEDLLLEIVYVQDPDSQIYAVLGNGDILVGTYVRTEKVIGWTRFITTGSYEHAQSITEGNEDQVWVVVKRTINGSTKRYVELFNTGDGTDDLHSFSDSYLTYSQPKIITAITAASPAVVTSVAHGFSNGDTVKIIDVVGMVELNNRTFTVANKANDTFELGTQDSTSHTAYVSGGEAHVTVTIISGLDHLEGETVQLRVDGAVQPSKTVSSGSITLSKAGVEVVAGLSYTTTIVTLDREYDIGAGSMQGQLSRHVHPLIKVYRSTRPLIDGEFIPARSAADNMDEKVPLFTGILEYQSLNWDNKLALTITVTDPLPLQLLLLTGTSEGHIT